MKLRIGLCLAAVLAASCELAQASPNAATHVVQTPIGVNESTYVYLETILRYPTNYYSHTEIQRIVTRRKVDDAVIDSTTVSHVGHHRDEQDGHPLPRDVETLPAFDLTAFVRARGLHLLSPSEFTPMAVDSIGIYFVEGDQRRYWIRSPDIQRRLLPRPNQPDPVVRDVYRAYEPWDGTPSDALPAYVLIESGDFCCGDTDGARSLVYVDRLGKSP